MDARYPAKSRKNQSGILAETVGHAGGNGRVFRQRTDEPIRTRTALPNMRTSEQLAMVLQVPMAYLYCPEDELAELILKVSSLTPEFKKELTRFIEQLLAAQGSTSRQPVRTRSEL